MFDAWASPPGGAARRRPRGTDRRREGHQGGRANAAARGSREGVSIDSRLTEANAIRDDMRVDRLFERFVSIPTEGEAALAYHGSTNPETGQLEFGFPLPVTGADGDVTWSIRPTPDPYEGQLGIYDAVARHAEGPVLVQGSSTSTHRGSSAPGARAPRTDALPPARGERRPARGRRFPQGDGGAERAGSGHHSFPRLEIRPEGASTSASNSGGPRTAGR